VSAREVRLQPRAGGDAVDPNGVGDRAPAADVRDERVRRDRDDDQRGDAENEAAAIHLLLIFAA